MGMSKVSEGNAKLALETKTVVRPGRGRLRTEVGIEDLLRWAFQREFAKISFDVDGFDASSIEDDPCFGLEWIMIERAKLGCRVDGGGTSEPHPDATLVADALSVLPDFVGGRRMAIWIAELARADASPDWGAGLVTRCEPKAWRNSKYGAHAVREYNTDLKTRWPSHQIKGKDWGYVCPVMFSGTAREIGMARRNYLQWFGALLDLRNTFQMFDNLSSFKVTDQMPDREPWKNHLT
jgi:hypothetical protein